MGRGADGSGGANELDRLGRDDFPAPKISLARATSAVHHFNRTRRRGHNAMTERRIKNDLGFTPADPSTFPEPSPEELRAARERTASNLRLFWERRRFLLRWTFIALVVRL